MMHGPINIRFPFDAFVCVIIRASCKHQNSNAFVIRSAVIVIKALLFYNDLRYWISHAECTIYTKLLSYGIYLTIYYLVSLCLSLRYVDITVIQIKLSCLLDRTANSSFQVRGVRA